MSGHPLRCSRAGDVVQSQKFEEVVQKRESHIRPRPGRRRTIISRSRFPLFTLVFLLLVTLCTPAVASNRFRIHDKGSVQLADNLAEGQVIEVSPEILFDPRPAPASLLRKRQEEDVLYGRSSSENSTETGKRKEASRTASAASTTSSESTDTGIDSAPTGTNSPLPTAFDGGLGTNYTQETCPVFLRGMVSAQNFTSCLPFSVLLQNSQSFFQASRSLANIMQVLQASCSASLPTCSNVMSTYAATLRSPTGCQNDWNQQQPFVRQAYNALLAYDTLYNASCLKAQPSQYNNQSSNYCFADAITNTSAPTTNYVYYLPLGLPLPAGTQPTCDQCLRDTMNTFFDAAANRSQPISLTYVNAAQLVDINCGPNFINASAPAPLAGTSGGGGSPNGASSRWAAGGVGPGWKSFGAAVALSLWWSLHT